MSKIQEIYAKFDDYIVEHKSKLEECLVDLEIEISNVQLSDEERGLLEEKLYALYNVIQNL